jgi:hypothetical protein
VILCQIRRGVLRWAVVSVLLGCGFMSFAGAGGVHRGRAHRDRFTGEMESVFA